MAAFSPYKNSVDWRMIGQSVRWAMLRLPTTIASPTATVGAVAGFQNLNHKSEISPAPP